MPILTRTICLWILVTAAIAGIFAQAMAAQTGGGPSASAVEAPAIPLSTAFVTDSQTASRSGLETLLAGLTPHPYLYAGPSIMGGGYAKLAYRAEAGLNVESRHWIMKALGAYDDGHKIDDGDQPNPNGHDRYLEGAIYVRPSWLPSQLAFLGNPSHWFLGAGYRWNQLSTSNYTKGVNGPLIGGGYDLVLRSCPECYRNFSMRIAVDWLTAGNDWQNGSHGPQINLSYPTPREDRHLFFVESLAIYRFHETVTEPTNVSLTQQQRSQQYFGTTCDFGLIYRF